MDALDLVALDVRILFFVLEFSLEMRPAEVAPFRVRLRASVRTAPPLSPVIYCLLMRRYTLLRDLLLCVHIDDGSRLSRRNLSSGLLGKRLCSREGVGVVFHREIPGNLDGG